MKSYQVFFESKYPKGRVETSEHHVEVYDRKGKFMHRLEKDGSGCWHDLSVEHGGQAVNFGEQLAAKYQSAKLDAQGKIIYSAEAEAAALACMDAAQKDFIDAQDA